jgi:flavin-dependent dehydrogenase
MKNIVIAGGGVAGLSLGIALRRRDVPVEIFEAGNYPRHRVCGEFISGRGQETLERLELAAALREADACAVRSIAFYSERRCCMRRPLPRPALAISRWSLDSTLATQFERLGGVLRRNTKWKSGFSQPGVVRAAGRQRNADGRWFGMKIHARDVALEADLEMHFLRGGYIGLCRLADGAVNVCGLFSSVTAGSHPRELLRGTAGSLVNERLRQAEFEAESFCAVAGLPLHTGMQLSGEARVGDALVMVPPVTGNGMSFAFESAEVAAGPISEFAAQVHDWTATLARLHRVYRTHFARRLFWANHLHRVLLRFGSTALWFGCGNVPLWRTCFALTR